MKNEKEIREKIEEMELKIRDLVKLAKDVKQLLRENRAEKFKALFMAQATTIQRLGINDRERETVASLRKEFENKGRLTKKQWKYFRDIRKRVAIRSARRLINTHGIERKDKERASEILEEIEGGSYSNELMNELADIYEKYFGGD